MPLALVGAPELVLEALLRLPPEWIVDARPHDNWSIAAVGGFRDNTRVVRGLARLNMTDYKTFSLECRRRRVFEQAGDAVCRGAQLLPSGFVRERQLVE